MFTQSTLEFLNALAANNTRDWFDANRSTYVAAVRDPAQAFARELSLRLEEQGQGPVTPRIFRINRDLRFSKDKTPYNTHVHMAFHPASGGPEGPGWMVGIEPGRLTLGAGLMRFSPGQLARWRDSVGGPGGAALQASVDGLLGQGAVMDPPDLSRVPAPHAADHPRADLLRRKGVVVWQHRDDTDHACGPDGPARCAASLTAFTPIIDGLVRVLRA